MTVVVVIGRLLGLPVANPGTRRRLAITVTGECAALREPTIATVLGTETSTAEVVTVSASELGFSADGDTDAGTISVVVGDEAVTSLLAGVESATAELTPGSSGDVASDATESTTCFA